MALRDDIIASLVEAVAALNGRVTELGTSVDLRPTTIEPDARVIAQAVDDWMARNADKVRGKDGESVTIDDLRAIANDWLKSNITQPKDGENGKDAPLVTDAQIKAQTDKWLNANVDDLKPTNEQIAQAASEWLALNIKQPKDGKNATDEQIAQAADAWLSENITQPADGKDGTNGTNGLDGRGIDDAEIDRDGELILTFSDGEQKNLGRVVGQDGVTQTVIRGGATGTGSGDGVQSVVAGTGIIVDNTDPKNPVINAIGGGGSAVTYTKIAGQELNAYKILTTNALGRAIYASADNLAHVGKIIGISQTSANTGGIVIVQEDAEITNAGWNFAVGALLYLGLNGDIVTNQIGLFSNAIGYAVTSNTIKIRIGRSIIRA